MRDHDPFVLTPNPYPHTIVLPYTLIVYILCRCVCGSRWSSDDGDVGADRCLTADSQQPHPQDLRRATATGPRRHD